MIPLRPSTLDYSSRWPKRIILGNVIQEIDNMSIKNKFRRTTPAFQTYSIEKIIYKELKKYNSGFHYIVDYIKNDYYVINNQPIMTKCNWKTIPEEFQSDIFVGFIGDFDNELPSIRMYDVVTYRLLAPLMRSFRINISDVIFFRDITNNPNETAPGELFNQKIFNSFLKKNYRKVSLRRV